MEQEPLIPEVLETPRLGASGPAPNNGNGRPRGARNLKHRALERAARSESLPIVRKVIAQALDGDMYAARLILDRIWPRPRTAPIQFELAPTKTPAEIRQAMHELLGKIARGDIAPDEGAAISAIMRDVLDAHRIQTFDLGATVEVQQSSARDQLADRLARAIEERRRGIGAGEETATSPLPPERTNDQPH